MIITDKKIEDAKPGTWLVEEGPRGAGRLCVYVGQKGKTFHFRYTGSDGKQMRLPLKALTLDEARDEAIKWARTYRLITKDLHAHVAAQEQAEAEREAAEAAAKASAETATLGVLLTAYADMLESAGKVSAKAVRLALVKHVNMAYPDLWAKPAAAITLDDCVTIVAKLVNADKPREADKVRSYLKSAYRAAINARGNTKAPQVLRDMRITANPVADVDKVEGSSNATERALSLTEFRCYWRRIQALPEPRRSLAMLHVLTGGQRIQQLARVTVADIDRDTPAMRMTDSKGRRSKPRIWQVPLLPEALACIDRLGNAPYIFSSNGGTSASHASYLSDIAKEVCTQMAEAGELEGTPFTASVIRHSAETRLVKAPYRVSSDVLARLLSHGLGGVAQRHYQHDEMYDEMLEALEKLRQLLTEEPAKIIKLHG